MYAGEIVEHGPVGHVFARPRHPYTVALLDCLPRVDRPAAARFLPAIEGTLPDPRAEVHACQFAPRCGLAEERCRREHPGWFEAAPGHGARCFYWDRVPGRRARPGRRRPPRPRAGRARRPAPRSGRLPRGGRPRSTGTGRCGRWTASPSPLPPARRWRSSGRAARGRRPPRAASRASSSPPRARSGSTAGPVPRRPAAWPRALRRRLQIVFQNPDLTLNPRRRILEAVARPLTLFGLADRRGRRAAAARLLEAVGLDARALGPVPGPALGRASASAWRSRARSRPGRSWSSATSPPRLSTCRCRRRC